MVQAAGRQVRCLRPCCNRLGVFDGWLLSSGDGLVQPDRPVVGDDQISPERASMGSAVRHGSNHARDSYSIRFRSSIVLWKATGGNGGLELYRPGWLYGHAANLHGAILGPTASRVSRAITDPPWSINSTFRRKIGS